MKLQEDIRRYVNEFLLPGEDSDAFSNDDDLLNSGVLDSLSLVSLVAYLEQKFKREIHPTEMTRENFHSITAITQFVHSKSGVIEK